MSQLIEFGSDLPMPAVKQMKAKGQSFFQPD